MYQVWIYIIAFLIVVPSALLGAFLLLRKSTMVSDAISHSILPGLVIGFLIAKSLYSPILLILATVFGVLTVFIIEWAYKGNRIKKDASIGLSYTFLFAVGVLLIANFTSSNSELHQDCILYGDLSAAPLNTLFINNYDCGPKAFWTLITLNIIVLSFIILGWRALKASTFDVTFAQTIGFKPQTWNYILMTIVSFTVVVAFDIVGAVLIIAFLAGPSATAFLLSKRLIQFTLNTLLISIINTILGIFISSQFNLVLSATLALCQGLSFFIVFIFIKIFKKV